jgi:methanethiol S-methyltransferase
MQLILNFLTVLLYGSIHSLLASRTIKTWVRNRLGEPSDRLYRAAFNLIGAFLFLPVLIILGIMHGETIYIMPTPWLEVTLVLQAGLLVLFVGAFLQTQPMSFLGIAQLVGIKESSGLRTTGFYGWVRHPLYTLGLAMLWLMPVMTTGMIGFAGGVTLYILIGSAFEEKRLAEEFGEAYKEYQRRVSKLIPFLY